MLKNTNVPNAQYSYLDINVKYAYMDKPPDYIIDEHLPTYIILQTNKRLYSPTHRCEIPIIVFL